MTDTCDKCHRPKRLSIRSNPYDVCSDRFGQVCRIVALDYQRGLAARKEQREHYKYDEGNHCTLDKLCRTNPEWAASLIRQLKQRNADLERELTEIRTLAARAATEW